MKLSQSSIAHLEGAIKKAIGKLANKEEQTIVTDIHLQPHQQSGDFIIYDDDDKELANVTIEEWITYTGEDFYAKVEQELAALLGKLKSDGCFDALPILKPYSFVLIDDERETLSELLLMDDDTMLVSEELLKGLDEELDTFLKELLEK